MYLKKLNFLRFSFEWKTSPNKLYFLKIKGNSRHRSTIEVSACESFPHSAVFVANCQTQGVKWIVESLLP